MSCRCSSHTLSWRSPPRAALPTPRFEYRSSRVRLLQSLFVFTLTFIPSSAPTTVTPVKPQLTQLHVTPNAACQFSAPNTPYEPALHRADSDGDAPVRRAISYDALIDLAITPPRGSPPSIPRSQLTAIADDEPAVATTKSANDDVIGAMPDSMPPEPQRGNIEYKLKLIDTPADRLVHLATQMKWRLAEGLRLQCNVIIRCCVDALKYMMGACDS